MNRLTSKTHSDTTPAANFYYDEGSVTVGGNTYTLSNTKGRLSHTSAANGTAITIDSYDAAGRVVDYWQCTPFNCTTGGMWNAHYNHDLGGDVPSWTHPAGFTITNTINAAQQISQITSSLSDTTHPGTLATITYTPFGALSTLLNGCAGTGCVQRQETYDYNNRLQPVRIQLGTAASNAGNSCLVYNYYPALANPTSCTIPAQSGGNVDAVVGYFYQDNVNPSLNHTTSYVLDSMLRLTSSVATGSSRHNLTFSYDRYGNMTCTTNGSTQGLCTNLAFNTATNRITTAGYSYDAAGNLTQDPSSSPTNAAANPSGDASGVSGTAKPELFTTKPQRRKRKQ